MKDYRKFCIAVAVVMASWLPVCAHAQEIRIVHYEFRPLFAEILKTLLKETGIKGEMKVYPWKRAYNMALEEKNILIGPTRKTEEREKLLKWLDVPVNVIHMNLYKLKERQDIVINALDDVRKYKIGAVSGYSSAQYLMDRGFKENLDTGANSEEQNIRKLVGKRFDLLIMADTGMSEKLEQLGLEQDALESAYTLFSEELFFAFSSQTSDEIVNRFRAALRTMREDGRLEQLTQQYGR